MITIQSDVSTGSSLTREDGAAGSSRTREQRAAYGHACVQCISPYLNPAHVLAPPRAWLESVLDGSISWEFFRLRYKNLLRTRFKDDPEPFFALLEESGAGHELLLTCHCLAGPCHAEVARDFLEKLREQEPFRRWSDLRRQITLFPLPLHHVGSSAH
ncbi:MAG: hypothetical protein ACHQZQ_05855 [SAR324 cluster bacterium]